jgi:hypothetical protein
MLMRRQNSYALRSKRRIGRPEGQNCEPVNNVQKLSVRMGLLHWFTNVHCCHKLVKEK